MTQFALTRDETHLLRFTCDLYAEDESPLGPFEALDDAGALQAAARTLVDRGLADKKTFRPNRELLRRLLILAQPDARVVLMTAGPAGGRHDIDVYERAGAFLPYSKLDAKHILGAPVDFGVVFDDIMSQFSPRRSTGDFLDITLSAAEYFAFALMAGDLATRSKLAEASADSEVTDETVEIRPPTPEGPTEKNEVIPGGLAAQIHSRLGDEGTPIHRMLERLPRESSVPSVVPSEAEWMAAVDGLLEKGLATRNGERHVLRPYLVDLAVGLATKRRKVLTRFDFGAEDWLVRDATFIDVPGSLFLVRAAREGALQILELDAEGLEKSVRITVESVGNHETIEFG